jgi:hypothetical protein
MAMRVDESAAAVTNAPYRPPAHVKWMTNSHIHSHLLASLLLFVDSSTFAICLYWQNVLVSTVVII